MGASILPIAIYKNKVYFLFGKENKYNDTPGWSDFGGGTEKGESFKKTAEREGMEELTGFLGMEKDIKKLMKAHGTFNIDFGDKRTYRIHMVPMKFDPSLPKLYNNNHAFLERKLSPNLIKTSKIFEKEEIRWISEDELPKMRNKFRSFYRVAVDDMLAKKAAIRTFARKALKKPRKTRRKKSTAKKALKRKTRRMRGGNEQPVSPRSINQQVGLNLNQLLNLTASGVPLNSSSRPPREKIRIRRLINDLPDDILNHVYNDRRLTYYFEELYDEEDIEQRERDLIDIAVMYADIKNLGSDNSDIRYFLDPIQEKVHSYADTARHRVSLSNNTNFNVSFGLAQSILRRREQNQAPRNLSLAVPDNILNEGTTNY